MADKKSAKPADARSAGANKSHGPLDSIMHFEMGEGSSLTELRLKAEEQLEQQIDRLMVEKLRTGDISTLVHELCTYQIELEMQTEELRRSQEELEKSHHRFVERAWL